jgi:hypothetical protein
MRYLRPDEKGKDVSPVYRFTCNHVGRTAGRSEEFIRVAEIRNARCTDINTPCPPCVSAGHGVAVDHDRRLLADRQVTP